MSGVVRVLVVEDDPEDALLTRGYLSDSHRLSFQTELAASPDQALDLMSRGQHDVCLLDYMLGTTDGLSLFAAARRGGYNRPVILLTGQANGDVADVALEAGISDFIEKQKADTALLERTIRYTLERRRAQQEIYELNLSLEQRVKERTAELQVANEELEAFAYSISHDLRAPLRSIIGFSKVLLEDFGERLDPKAIELVERQAAAAKRLSDLTDDLLRLSRLTRQEMIWSDVDLSRLAAELTDELKGRTWSQPPKFEIQPEMRTRGDRGLLRTALLNLMENACKFSPEGAKIEVGATHIDGEDVYFVRDHGIGFNPEYAHRVFQPFDRLVKESEFPGTGIGLATVERVIKRHGGRIWVETSPGAGATFFFVLGS